jgi:transcriptional regulator with XRE-family HTH domain
MLRIERKVTQQELVGDYITRNMLSQIENDVASPSIKTLEFLADRLGVPLSYLMQTDHDGDYGTEYETTDSIDFRAKKMFLSGDFLNFIDTVEKNPSILEEYEEEKLFLGFAYLAYAEQHFNSGNMNECVKYCKKVMAIDFKGFRFAEERLKKQAAVYRNLCDAESADSYAFLRTVLDGNSLCKYNIISAKEMIETGNPEDAEKALEYLKEAEQIIKDSGTHPYLREIYKTFEACYVALGDYKNAYFYSSLLLNLYAGK